MMRRLSRTMPLAVVLAALLALPLAAATIAVSTQPPGAEIMWSLDHDPLVHMAGAGPVGLDVPEQRELTVVACRDGYWPTWRRVPVSQDGALQMDLRPISVDLSDIAMFGDNCAVGALTVREPEWRAAPTWAAYHHNVRWSPDGRHAAWSRVSEWHGDRTGDLISTLTLITPATKSAQRRAWSLWKGLGDYYRYDVDWSHDGEFLLVSRPPARANGLESIDLIEIDGKVARPLISDPELSCYYGTASGADRLGFIKGGFRQPWTMWACDWRGQNRVKLGKCDEVAPCGTVDGRLVWANRDKVCAYDGGEPQVLLTLPSDKQAVMSLTSEPMSGRVLIIIADRKTGLGWQGYVWSPRLGAVRLAQVGDRAQWLAGGYILDSSFRLIDAAGGKARVRGPVGYWRTGVPAPVPWPLFD